MKDIFFFDLDGTLTNPKLGITTCVAYALRDQGIEVTDLDTLTPFIGPPLIEGFQAITGLTYEQAERATAKYRERFSVVGLFENEMYDGIIPMLEALRHAGARLFVATSKPEPYSVRIAEHFGFAKYFEQICGATLDGRMNTKDAVIADALHRAGNPDPSRVLMIGDRKHDILGAHKCGIDCAGVLFGFGSREEHEQAGADIILETVTDLHQYLLDQMN